MILAVALIVSLVLNTILFLVAFRRQTDKLTDLAYAISFLTITLVALIFADHRSLVLSVASSLVALWAFRLGGFLVYRISLTGRDPRFDAMRANFLKFLGFWLAQAVVAWVLLLPLLFVSMFAGTWTVISGFGAAVSLVGLIVEAIADWQKFTFRRKAANRNKWIETGLWRYSRHPNYFGEIMMWTGIYLLVMPSLSLLLQIIAFVSPVVITVMLCFFSGIPPLEAFAMKTWGKDQRYLDYKKTTSILIPLPRRRI